MGSRCMGHCCNDFTLSLSPEQVARLPAIVNDSGQESLSGGKPRLAKDGEQIRDMLIYLGYRKYENGELASGMEHLNEPRHHYSCKNFKDGNCSIYHSRPSMCRNFPSDGGACEFAACQWDKVRSTKANAKPQLSLT